MSTRIDCHWVWRVGGYRTNHTTRKFRARWPRRERRVYPGDESGVYSSMDSSDDDAAPEEPPLEAPGGSGGMRMSLNMGSLTNGTSGSNLFKEEDAAIKGGEVTLNFTDEVAGKEFQLNVRRQTPPRVHSGTHSPRPIPRCRSLRWG